MPLWPWHILVTLYGACIGSFLNVVVYRLPEGLSLVHPPSSCPRCGHRLAWYDNIPVLGWLMLGGRCRYCKAGISVQYPLVEALTAALFGGLFWAYYVSGWRGDFMSATLDHTWPVLVVHLSLLAGLLAATLIDARLFIIPLQIPWTATLLALVILPAAAWWYPTATAVLPVAEPMWWGSLLGAAAGLAVANLLLWAGFLPHSFAEEPGTATRDVAAMAGEAAADEAPVVGAAASEAVAEGAARAEPPSSETAVVESPMDLAPASETETAAGDSAPTQPINPPLEPSSPPPPTTAPPSHGTPEEWLAHPHPRREVLKEVIFLLPIILGAAAGYRWLSWDFAPNPALQVLAGVAWGYLLGGGAIWVTRILGTLAFGKEAMGLGDVHLLAAIGAVIGGYDAMLVFFMAPFLGLLYTLVAVIASRMTRGDARVIPYGPYLAAAAVMLMALRDPLLRLLPLP